MAKRITNKFFWSTVITLLLGFLMVLDILTTLVGINMNVGIEECNPLAMPYVENPWLWYILTVIQLGGFFLINWALWIIDKKTEKTVDYITLVFIMFQIGFCIARVIVVINNILILYTVLA